MKRCINCNKVKSRNVFKGRERICNVCQQELAEEFEGKRALLEKRRKALGK
ncbi:MAG: hypothetical protein ACM3SR_16180 [Ignavibacteriales bacterium]